MANGHVSLPNRRVFPVLLAVGAALVVAVASVTLPGPLLLALLAAGATVALLLLSRLYVNEWPPLSVDGKVPPQPWWHAPEAAATAAERADPLRLGRYLFYAGMLTIGQTSVRPVGGLTVSDWLFFSALWAVLAGLALGRSPVTFRVPTLVVVGVALYVVSGLLSTFQAAAPLVSAANVARFGYLTLVWFWLATLVLTQPKHLRAAIAMWTASLAIDGLAAVVQAGGVSMVFVSSPIPGRMTGFTPHPNELGAAAATVIAPACALLVTSTRLRQHVVWGGAFVSIVAAVILSGSVSGMAAAIAAIGVWIVTASRGPRLVVIAFAALFLAVAVAQIQGDVGLPTPVDRLLSTTGYSQGGQYSTVATRVQGYRATWAALGNGGLLGHGLDSSSPNPDGARSAHNLLLKAWYEGGLAGAIGMLCVILGGLASSLHGARLATTASLRLLAASLFAATAAFFVYSQSSPLLSQRYGWACVALGLSCVSIARAGAGGMVRPEGGDEYQADSPRVTQ